MDEVLLMPREAGKVIADGSKDVKINPEGVKKVAQFMAECVKTGTYSIKSWKQHDLNPKTMDKSALDWIFVADTLNFSFWSADDNKKYMVRYGDKEHTGYWSLCAAINRAIDEGIPLTDSKYFASITMDTMRHVFRSDSEHEIPLLEERHQVLTEAGKVLVEKYDGSFANVIKKCEKSAQALMRLVVDEFVSYRDVTQFEGKEVAIYKRVQILIADIWACFEGQGYGEFHDIDSITMFADYRIPQALLYFGALEYSDELQNYLGNDHLLKSGDRYEVEIRGCSIWATELINEETRRILDADPSTKGMLVNSILIDHYLWDYRRDHADDMKNIPFHKYQDEVRDLRAIVSKQEQIIDHQRSLLEALQAWQKSVNVTLHQHDTASAAVRRQIGGGIAFTAYLDHTYDLTDTEHVVFNKVLFNDGTGYNPSTGIFVCQEPGVYLFTFVVSSRQAKVLACALMVNGQLQLNAVADSFHPGQGIQGSTL